MIFVLMLIWIPLAGWVGVAIYTLGDEFWMPSLWPVIFGLWFTWRIWQAARRLKKEDGLKAANISRKPASARRSGTGTR